MQLFVKINDKTNTIQIDNDIEDKYEKLQEIIEEKIDLNRIFFSIRSPSKIITKTEDLRDEITLELSWHHISTKKLYMSNNDEKYFIPSEILIESEVITSLLNPLDDKNIDELLNNITEENKLIFNSNNIINKKLINHWINISCYTKNFLSPQKKKLNDIQIPKPLLNCSISVYIGDETFKYL